MIKNPLNIFSKECYNYIEELGFGCFAGKESICVDALGNVRPCSHFPRNLSVKTSKTSLYMKYGTKAKFLKCFEILKAMKIATAALNTLNVAEDADIARFLTAT